MMEHSDIGAVTPIEKYLSRRQVADIFGVSPQTISRWVGTGKLRATSAGTKLYISPAAVREFAAEQEKVSRGCLTETPSRRGGPGPVRRARFEADRQADAS